MVANLPEKLSKITFDEKCSEHTLILVHYSVESGVHTGQFALHEKPDEACYIFHTNI